MAQAPEGGPPRDSSVAAVIVYSLARATGPLSYAFYLVHATLLSVVFAVMKPKASGSPGWMAIAAVVASFAIAALLSHWLYHSIERPARARMLRLQTGWYTGNDSATVPAAMAEPRQP